MNSISTRLIELIDHKTNPSRRFKELEEATNISALSWRKAWNGGQRPTVEMLQSVSRLWPEYAFWLMTGITDSQYGHISPNGSILEDHYLPKSSASEYFKYRTKVLNEIERIDEERKGDGLRKLDFLYKPTFEKLHAKYPRFFTITKHYLSLVEQLNKLDSEEKELISTFEREVSSLKAAREEESKRLGGRERDAKA